MATPDGLLVDAPILYCQIFTPLLSFPLSLFSRPRAPTLPRIRAQRLLYPLVCDAGSALR